MPGGGGFALPDTPEVSTSSVARGGDSTGRISASGGRGHEHPCSETVLTARWRSTDARSEPPRARFSLPYTTESTYLLGAFWPNRVTSERFPGAPGRRSAFRGLPGKKRYQTHQVPGAAPPLSSNRPSGAVTSAGSVTRCSRSLHVARGMRVGSANTASVRPGPPRAALPGVRGPGKAAPLPRVQDSGAYSPPGRTVETGQ